MARPVPTPQTDFTLSGYFFEVQQAGPYEDLLVTFFIGESKGRLSYYYGWFPDTKMTAVDWSVLHNKKLRESVVGRFTAPLTSISVENAVRIDRFAPDGNRTQIGIAAQRQGFFLVRFIISLNEDRLRHMFMLHYRGEAPKHLVGKVYWGHLVGLGDTPASAVSMMPRGTKLTD
jgi:hypothetical protein